MPIHDSPEKCGIGDGILLITILEMSDPDGACEAFLDSDDGHVVFRPALGGPARTFEFEEYPTADGTEFGWTRTA